MSAETLTFALAPLDERPVNTRYPQMIGAIAGAQVQLPPAAIRGQQRIPADTQSVGSWLAETGATSDAVIASVEYLAYGNLINSRISNDSTADALTRLSVLETLAKAGKPVYAFNLITRIPNADDCVEEPLYWANHGTRLFRYSQLLHKRAAGKLAPGEAEAITVLERQIPSEHITDWLNRRLRNHTINLSLIDLLARERLSFLLITSDDTAEWGLASREKAWLESWMSLLASRVSGRLLMHPGADEVGSALVARLVCQLRGAHPTIYPLYAIPEDKQIIAPYEDRPVYLTVEGQIRACGGEIADSAEHADIILGILPPSPRRTEFREEFAESERQARLPHYRALFEKLGEWQNAGRSIALGDVAYPNGADPIAMEILFSPESPLAPAKLASYGGWNTAGNTLGTVVAQAVCSLFIDDDPVRQRAQDAFLAHRFLEDYGYQTVVRKEARVFCQQSFGTRDPDPENPEQISAVCKTIEQSLERFLTARLLPSGIGAGLQLVQDSVRLPWRRTFEVDFAFDRR